MKVCFDIIKCIYLCVSVREIYLCFILLLSDHAGIPYTLSKSGRPAIFTRDPDANALEFTQVDG